MTLKITGIIVNTFIVLVLVGLLIFPIYFVKNFPQVAGIKTESQFLIISQVEKFPGMVFTQKASQYNIQFIKNAPSQAYLSILILNNPTGDTKKYQIKNLSTNNTFFFGEDYITQNPIVVVPQNTSIPISLLSKNERDTQSADFEIIILD